MMKALFQEKGANLRIDILAEKPAQDFINAHADALNSGFQQVKMSDAMRRRLQRSNYIFSGMKTFHELNEAFPSLIDENGNRKPFEQFLNDVQKIDRTYNQNYLRAEYNFCQASADMAAKWEEFQQDGDRYNLQYRTAHDDRVRPEHAALDRVTLPITDPFWESYYPPNGWNCRCTVVQVRKSKYPVTPHDEAMALGEEATGKDTKGIFHFNPGIEQKTFPDYNPYTIRRCRDCDIAKSSVGGGTANAKLAAFIPENELCDACQLLHRCQYAKPSNKVEYERLKKDENYIHVRFNEETGALAATHTGHNWRHDPHDSQRFFGTMTKEDLESECIDNIFRMGHKSILRDESKMGDKGKTLSCLDLDLDDTIMDIASITKGDVYGYALMGKNSQLRRAREQSGDISDAVMLYFHQPDMFTEEKMQRDLQWYKNRVIEVGTAQRIHHVYVVINGAEEIKHYEI